MAMANASVWVVDDDDSYRELLALVLQTHCGISAVRTFGRGEDALRELHAAEEDRRPAWMLLDFHLPGIDALGMLEDLRDAGLPVPAAVVSSGASAQERAACERAGAVTFIEKPGRLEDLVRALAPLAESLQPPAPDAPPP